MQFNVLWKIKIIIIKFRTNLLFYIFGLKCYLFFLLFSRCLVKAVQDDISSKTVPIWKHHTVQGTTSINYLFPENQKSISLPEIISNTCLLDNRTQLICIGNFSYGIRKTLDWKSWFRKTKIFLDCTQRPLGSGDFFLFLFYGHFLARWYQ